MEYNIKVESGLQLFSRLNSRPDISKLDAILFPDGFNTKGIVEINGNSSMGKTTLLTHLIKNAILINKYKHITVGGLNVAVILIDMDIKFSVFQLIGTIKSSINDLRTKYEINNEDEDNIIEMSLRNMIFIRSFNSTQLYYSIFDIREKITEESRITLLFIDNIAANYWQDSAFNRLCKMDLYKQKMLYMLQKHIVNFNVAVVYTKPNYFESSVPIINTKKESFSLTKINLQLGDMDHVFTAEVNNQYMCNYVITSNGLKWI